MKTIDLTGEVPSLQDLLRLASEDNLILRAGDGKEFLLAEVDEFEHEVALTRQNKELMALLEERSSAGQTFTLEQVRETLGLD
jgi:hypothetical protein